MSRFRIVLALLAASNAWAFEAPLTLVVDYETPLPDASLRAMQREFDKLVQNSKLKVEWKLKSDFRTGDSVGDLAVIKFRGRCEMQPMPVVLDERGPLAFTHTINGEVLPFAEVLCDNVREAARSAMFGGDFENGDSLFGRALGRVLAHEVFHIVRQSKHHDKDGVFKPRLTGAQLIR